MKTTANRYFKTDPGRPIFGQSPTGIAPHRSSRPNPRIELKPNA